MAITLLSANLNTYGDDGQFETDRSTWGFADHLLLEMTRKLGGHTSSFSCQYRALGSTGILSGARARFNAEAGKKYVLRARVYTHENTVFADDSAIVAINESGSPSGVANFTVITSQLISDFKATGVSALIFSEIETRFDCTETKQFTHFNVGIITGGNTINDGLMLVDEFEVFEYEDQAPPSCTITIDSDNTTIADESAPAAGDGSIDVAVTGGIGTTEYNIDGGTWQTSSQFTGLNAGIYSIGARDQANPTCEVFQTFAINSSNLAWDMTVNATNETVVGLNDGTIVVTITGTPDPPYSYSIDGGQNFQGSNSFAGLAPGTYTVVVQDNSSGQLAENAVILAGIILFEKIFFSKNPIQFDRSETANSGEENYAIYNEVLVEEVPASGQFNKTLAQKLVPDTAGQVQFNLRQAFRGVLDTTPPPVTTAITKVTDGLRLYKNAFGDLFDDKTVPDSLTETGTFLVVLGGVDKKRFPTLDYFYSYLPTYNRFMTWAPDQKKVDKSQEDYLYFFNINPATVSIKQRVTAYYDDGTNQIGLIETKSGIAYGEVYIIPAGLQANVDNIDPAKTVVSYDLWLDDQNDAAISNTITFIRSKIQHPNARYIMFLNSLGRYDVIRMTGKTAEKTTVAKAEVQKHLGFQYDPLQGEYQSHNSVRRNTIQYSTGFYSGKFGQYTIEYLQELLISPAVYDITYGDRNPIIIQPGSFTISKSENYKHVLRFVANEGYTNDVFTPKVLPT